MRKEPEEKLARPVGELLSCLAVSYLQTRLRSLHGLPHLVAIQRASEAERLRHGFDGYSLRGPGPVIVKDGEQGPARWGAGVYWKTLTSNSPS
jgi:hypothetical protein